MGVIYLKQIGQNFKFFEKGHSSFPEKTSPRQNTCCRKSADFPKNKQTRYPYFWFLCTILNSNNFYIIFSTSLPGKNTVRQHCSNEFI